jgi:hypothetical protein
MNRCELIRRFVLNEIADDYEELGKLYAEVADLGTRSGLPIEKFEILQELILLIESGLASAFILTTVPVQQIQGVPPLDKVEDYYFLVTDKGMELQLSDDSWWPFDDDFQLRKDWVAATE